MEKIEYGSLSIKNYRYVEGPGNFITNVVIRIIKQQDNVKKIIESHV
jgi:hypothetical protein